MIAVCVTIAGAQESPIDDAPLILFPAYLQTPLGQPVELGAETYPAGKKLAWTSLDPSVATVDADGCVTPVAVGETYVVCAFADDASIAEACGVRVTEGGNIFFWAYTPEPQDLDAIIAEMEQMKAEQFFDMPDVSWPDGLPRIDGKVDFASNLTHLQFRIQSFKIVSGVGGVELPIDGF